MLENTINIAVLYDTALNPLIPVTSRFRNCCMTYKADDTANKHLRSHAKELKEKVSRNQVITAPLPDTIAKNIEAIISLHAQEVREIPVHQRILEAIATFFGRSIFMYSLLVILALWIFSSFFDRFLPFNLPSFSWSGQGLDAASLVISTGVLVRQTRQENFAEQRAQLMLQLNLLSEQKIAKIIALLEELRTDLPDVINRNDSEAKLMQEPADPIAVLEALQKNLAEELSATEENNMS